jgi:hypothetical protein
MILLLDMILLKKGENNMKKVFISVLLILTAFLGHSISEALTHYHYYLWSDTNYAFWLDANSIKTSDSRTWASFNIIVEDMKTGEQVYDDNPIMFYKKNNEWYVSLYKETTKPIKEYDDYWQPWALDWLITNGYIRDTKEK